MRTSDQKGKASDRGGLSVELVGDLREDVLRAARESGMDPQALVGQAVQSMLSGRRQAPGAGASEEGATGEGAGHAAAPESAAIADRRALYRDWLERARRGDLGRDVELSAVLRVQFPVGLVDALRPLAMAYPADFVQCCAELVLEESDETEGQVEDLGAVLELAADAVRRGKLSKAADALGAVVDPEDLGDREVVTLSAEVAELLGTAVHDVQDRFPGLTVGALADRVLRSWDAGEFYRFPDATPKASPAAAVRKAG